MKFTEVFSIWVQQLCWLNPCGGACKDHVFYQRENSQILKDTEIEGIPYTSLATIFWGYFFQIWGIQTSLRVQGIKFPYREMEMLKAFKVFSLLKECLCSITRIWSCTLWSIINILSYIRCVVAFVKKDDMGHISSR